LPTVTARHLPSAEQVGRYTRYLWKILHGRPAMLTCVTDPQVRLVSFSFLTSHPQWCVTALFACTNSKPLTSHWYPHHHTRPILGPRLVATSCSAGWHHCNVECPVGCLYFHVMYLFIDI
jgi:hypothetical protein